MLLFLSYPVPPVSVYIFFGKKIKDTASRATFFLHLSPRNPIDAVHTHDDDDDGDDDDDDDDSDDDELMMMNL